jgi:hypothetical protein
MHDFKLDVFKINILNLHTKFLIIKKEQLVKNNDMKFFHCPKIDYLWYSTIKFFLL